jgi:histidine triad (HIT) family protein
MDGGADRETSVSGYDTNNVFAKILRGELPCHAVHEDDHTLAFMDIMPRADGHLLVIPKEPARNIFDVSPEALAQVIGVVRRLAQASRRAMAADGVTINQFNETAGGQVVFHLHFHIIPRKDGEALKPHGGAMASGEVLAAHAARIRAALAEAG